MGNGSWNGYIRQAGATIERIAFDASNRVRYVDVRQASAATERIAPYAGHGVGDGDARQVWAVKESIVSDASY